MKLALAQTNIIWEDKQANLEKLEAVLKEADADFVAFPEMSLTGFSMHTDVTAEEHAESVEKVKVLAHKYQTNIGFGWVKQTAGLCENHYSIVSPEADLLLDYAKIHPFSYSEEDKYFRGGDYVCIGRVAGFSVGAAICYDLRFPELFRAMTPEAELIVVPANWPGRRSAHWKALLPARAIENQCYIAAVNCCGDMDGQYYAGDSCLYAPGGTLVAPVIKRLSGSACEEEMLLLYDIKNDVQSVRDAFPVMSDRRDSKQFLIKS
ncbi:MAG: nitrilase-related carbon-nitrogen hydrolase [Wujia sp.]